MSAYSLYLEQSATFPSLDASEEVYVGGLFHLIHICSLDHLFVIEQYPRGLVVQLFADEGNVMALKLLALRLTQKVGLNLPRMNARTLVTNN